MGFKDVLLNENKRLAAIDDINGIDTEALYQRSKYYILMKEIESLMTPQLTPGETIQGYLPLTVADNTGSMNTGYNAQTYVTTEKARWYVDQFKDTRGNRVMIFTETRIIFLVIVEFFEENRYYSYAYDSIHSIFTKKHTRRYFDEHMKRQRHVWYLLDFQADNHVFDETLTQKDYETLKEIWQRIPAMARIPESNRVYRRNLFDRITSNGKLAFNVGFWLFNLPFAIFLIWVIWNLIRYALGAPTTMF